MPAREEFPAILLVALQSHDAPTHMWVLLREARILVVDEYAIDWIRARLEVGIEASFHHVDMAWMEIIDAVKEGVRLGEFGKPRPVMPPAEASMESTQGACSLAPTTTAERERPLPSLIPDRRDAAGEAEM